ILIALVRNDLTAFRLSSSFRNPACSDRNINTGVSLRKRSSVCSSFAHATACRYTFIKSLSAQSDNHDVKINVTFSLVFLVKVAVRSFFIVCFKLFSSRFFRAIIISSSEAFSSFDVSLVPSDTLSAACSCVAACAVVACATPPVATGSVTTDETRTLNPFYGFSDTLLRCKKLHTYRLLLLHTVV